MPHSNEKPRLPDVGTPETPIRLAYPMLGYRKGGFWCLRNPHITEGFFAGWIRTTDPVTSARYDEIAAAVNAPLTQKETTPCPDALP